MHYRLLTASFALAALVACGGGNAAADSNRVILVEDPSLKDVKPEPPPPPSQIGKLPLLDDPVGAVDCRFQNMRAGGNVVGREITVNAELRAIKVSVGAGPRIFEPVMLEVTGQGGAGDQAETETIFMSFSANGDVTNGRRRYSKGGSDGAAEARGLLPEDSVAGKRLALAIVERCPTPGAR